VREVGVVGLDGEHVVGTAGRRNELPLVHVVKRLEEPLGRKKVDDLLRQALADLHGLRVLEPVGRHVEDQRLGRGARGLLAGIPRQGEREEIDIGLLLLGPAARGRRILLGTGPRPSIADVVGRVVDAVGTG